MHRNCGRADATKVTSLLDDHVAVHLYDDGSATLTSIAGGHIGLTEDAIERLLTTLLARKEGRKAD